MKRRIELDYPPASTFLEDAEVAKFNDVLTDTLSRPIVDKFLNLLDNENVVAGIAYASLLQVPSIVVPILALGGDLKFEAAVKGSDRLKMCLGVFVKLRARTLGFEPTRKKGKLAKWTPLFRLSEIYRLPVPAASGADANANPVTTLFHERR